MDTWLSEAKDQRSCASSYQLNEAVEVALEVVT